MLEGKVEGVCLRARRVHLSGGAQGNPHLWLSHSMSQHDSNFAGRPVHSSTSSPQGRGSHGGESWEPSHNTQRLDTQETLISGMAPPTSGEQTLQIHQPGVKQP